MATTKTLTAIGAEGTAYKVSLMDADAWREIFPEWFQGKQRRLSDVELFRRQDYFRRAVKVRANAVSDIPWVIRPEGDAEAEPLLTHDMDDVPDDLQHLRGMRRVLFETEASVAVLGKAYRLIEQTRGQVDNLKLWPAHQVEPVVDRKEGIIKWRRRVNGGTDEQDPKDVIAIHDPDPFHDWNAWGDGRAAGQSGNVLHQLGTFLHSYLGRGLIKGTILTIEGNAPKDERDRLERWFNRFFGGADNAGRAKAVNAAVDPKVIGEGISDLSDSHLDERSREAVVTALGVPHSMVISNAANFATAQSDQLTFYLTTAIPDAKLIQDEMNNQFFHSQGLHFAFEPQKLEVMQRYELEKAEKVAGLVGRPILTVDEGRELLGYDPMEEQDGPSDLTEGQQNGQAENNEPEDLSPEAQNEVRLWKKKARKGRDASFEAHHIPREVQKTIRERLDLGESIETAFEPPWAF